jgi:Fe2+ transport system protein FeoA
MNITQCEINDEITITKILATQDDPTLSQHGLVEGEKIKILQNSSMAPILLQVRECRIAIHRSKASNIEVTKD